MTVAIDIAESSVFTALRSFVMAVVPDTEVIQGYDNRVAVPAGDYISMCRIRNVRLSTNHERYVDDPEMPENGKKDSQQNTEVVIQVDFWGDESADWAQMFSTLFRDDFAFRQFPDAVRPLFCDEPRHLPVVNSRKQWEHRWSVDAHLQYNPTVSTPMEFADTVEVATVKTETL